MQKFFGVQSLRREMEEMGNRTGWDKKGAEGSDKRRNQGVPQETETPAWENASGGLGPMPHADRASFPAGPGLATLHSQAAVLP